MLSSLDHLLRHPHRRLIALQCLGGAAVIAIATAAGGGVEIGAAEPPPSPGATLEHFPPGQVFRILGREVHSETGETIGRLVDILVDDNGAPRAAVVDFGGFLGVGSRKIAVDWGTLHFASAAEGGAISVDLDRDQIKAAPEYDRSAEAIPVVGPPTAELGR